jgi:2-keto-4-pentenoate hydratase/2-oxohepta-3-ene-1,7-dioic acid hydratase in catechol pathway
MKLTTFERGGKQSYGAVVGEGIVDLGGRFADLRALLAADGLNGIRASLTGVKPDFDLNEVTFLPVIPNPDKIVCVGLNYETTTWKPSASVTGDNR